MSTQRQLIELHDFDGTKIDTPEPIYQPDDQNVKQFATYAGRVFVMEAWSGWNGSPVVYYERHALPVDSLLEGVDPSERVN